ncbi:Neurogenic differentiation factor 1 [Labeo rohita]|uniref:Neurogenic differentiation factor 1 n=1 Tax=Labeo rohita TaxID=84645 RepID=A0ABQ8MZB5_LABRO|nr:Neurogenic differentiation factor 1 [Labeo rohita]
MALDLSDTYYHVLILQDSVFEIRLISTRFPLRPIPAALRLYEGSGGCPCPPQGRTWFSTIGPVGTSGQLGKEQTLPGTEDLFSRRRAGLGSEAPRAHGILSRGHAVGFDAHETAAALASYSSPQVGVASGHIPCEHHTIASPDTQPLDRHCVPMVRCPLGTSVQTHRCHHRCFQDRLGCHLQRAGSFRGLDRPPTVLAHKLSGVVGSASSSEEVPAYDSGQACVGQVRQHCDCGLHQPPGRCTLLSHVTTSPPSPALESTQTQVSTYHSHSGRNQSYSRFPVVTGFARRRVEAPPPVRSTGTQLAEGLAQVCVSSSEPHRTNFVQSQGGQGTDSLGGPLLAQQNLVLRPGAPGISPSLAHSSEGGPPSSGEGHILAPAPQSLEPPPMVPGRDQEDFRDLSPSVGLDRHLSASTLRVHVATISANHDLVGGRSVGKHDSEDDPNLTYVMPSPCPAHLHGTNSALEMFGTALVCYGGQQKGKVVSKQRISHWLVNTIWMAYRARGLPCPLEVRVHSTRGVAASAALANGASLTDICRAAGFLNANPGHHSIIGTPDVAEFGGGTRYEISTQGMVTSLTLGWIRAPYVVAPHVVAPCVYFPPITPVVVNSVVPFPSGNRHFPNVLKTLSRSTEEGPAAGHCCNSNPRSLMEGTETLCLPCHISGPPLSELRHSAPQTRTSEQMHTLPYYSRMSGAWQAMQICTPNFHWPFSKLSEVFGLSRATPSVVH